MTAEDRTPTEERPDLPASIDRDALQEAIYAVSLRHDWANSLDQTDRTDEIADEYEAIRAVKLTEWAAPAAEPGPPDDRASCFALAQAVPTPANRCDHRFQNGPDDPWQRCERAICHPGPHVWAEPVPLTLDAPHVPTPEELDILLSDISAAGYASEAREIVETWTRKWWGVESAFTTKWDRAASPDKGEPHE